MKELFNDLISVTVRRKQLDDRTRKFLAPAGTTVADLVAQAMLPAGTERFLHVVVNERSRVPRNMWSRVRVKAGQRVHMAPVYAGGDGGAGGGAGGGKAGGTLSMLGLLAGMVPGIGPFGQIAIGIALAAGAALLQPKKPRSKIGKNDAAGAQPSAGFSANILAPYDQIPMVLGQMRVAPSLLTQAWVEFFTKEIKFRGVVGLQGATAISDIRANGMAVDDFDGLDYEAFEGDGAAPTFTFLDHVGVTDEVNLPFTKHDVFEDESGAGVFTSLLRSQTGVPKWYSFLTRDIPDEVVLNVHSTGVTNPTVAPTTASRLYVHFRFRMRRKGEIAWRNLPELTYRTKPGYHQRKIRFKWYGNARLGNEVTYQDGTLANTAWSVYSNKGVDAPGQAAWTADPYFFENIGSSALGYQPGHTWGRGIEGSYTAGEEPLPATTPDGQDFVVWLHVDAWPQDKYEIQIMRSAITGGASGTYSAHAANGGWNFETSAFVTRIDPFLYLFDAEDGYKIAPEQFETVDEITLHSITYKWFESPMQRPNTAAIAFQLTNAQIDHLTALATSKVFVPATGTSGFSLLADSRNPAALWRHVLSNTTINRRPLDATLLDDAFLEWWFDYCELFGLTCDFIIESGNIADALPIIARAGDAFMALTAKDWRVWVDRDRTADSPTVVWSPRNTRGFQMEISFERVPDVISATFLDQDDDHAQTEIFVDRDGEIATPSDDQEVLAVDMRGITGSDQVIRTARREVRRGFYRRRTYTWEANVHNLAVDLGDLNGIAHDVLAGFFGWGYIVEVERSGAQILSITLDAKVQLPTSVDDVLTISDILDVEDIFAVAPPHVVITLRDGSDIVEAEVNPDGLTNVLTFNPPIADNVLIDEQCHVAVGGFNQTHRRVIIVDKQPGPDLTARITAKDEAPEIFEGEAT